MLTIHISRRVVFLLILGVLLAIPAGSWASHRFTDVDDSNIFHADISWLADAGVTKGCNPPTNDEFCPSNAVTREQMSAFMRRLAQYLDAEDGTPAQADNADTVDGQHASAFALKTDLPTLGGASCPGMGFIPTSSSFEWSGNPVRSRFGEPAQFTCPLDLPDGATITAFIGGFQDTSTTSSGWCVLRRMDVTGGGPFGLGKGTVSDLATTPITTGSFGHQTVTTSDIANPVVNARRYAYWAECWAGSTFELGINGVVVHYTLP